MKILGVTENGFLIEASSEDVKRASDLDMIWSSGKNRCRIKLKACWAKSLKLGR